MAPIGWDRSNDEIKINPKIYDVSNDKWVSKLPNSVDGVPSIQTAHRKFLRQFSISRDKTSGLIYISYTHYSPYISKYFIDSILDQIDKNYRTDAVTDANKSISYLKKEYEDTNISELRSGISNLIQKQIESITVANASTHYLFEQISKPYVPELKSGPSRSVIVIFGFIIGAIFSFFTIISIKIYKKFK